MVNTITKKKKKTILGGLVFNYLINKILNESFSLIKTSFNETIFIFRRCKVAN